MAKVNTVSRGRTNIRIGRGESAIVFSPTGVHNALSEESRMFIDEMITKGDSEAFNNITPEKFWTVVLPAVTYVKMAQYIKEVQDTNGGSTQLAAEDTHTDGEVETVVAGDATLVDSDDEETTVVEPQVPLEAFDG